MRKIWTETEDEYLKEHFSDRQTQHIANKLSRSYTSVANHARTLGLKKSAAYISSEAAGRQNLLSAGVKHRFKKGHQSWNKGKSYCAGGRSKETRFKKGRKPHNTRQDGAISIRSDKSGRKYKYVRISEAKWQLLQRVIWERENGKIEKGMIVAFKDGDTMNCNIENLELISRKENMKRNTIHNYPSEIKQAIRTISKLKKTIQHAEEQN